MDKLNEYFNEYKEEAKPYSFSRLKTIRTLFNSSVTSSMKPCIIFIRLTYQIVYQSKNIFSKGSLILIESVLCAKNSEFIEHKQNLEYVFRKRKQMGLFWKNGEMEKMIMSLVSTLGHMQSVGLCHRDLKPANLFLLNNGHIKVIDLTLASRRIFSDRRTRTMAVTQPQNHSYYQISDQRNTPILVTDSVEGSRSWWHGMATRDSPNTIFISLMCSQWVMESGTPLLLAPSSSLFRCHGRCHRLQPKELWIRWLDGEKLVVAGISRLREKFSENICYVLNLMLKCWNFMRKIGRLLWSCIKLWNYDVIIGI